MDMDVARGGGARREAGTGTRARNLKAHEGEARGGDTQHSVEGGSAGGMEGAATRTRRATGRMDRGRVVRRRNETRGGGDERVASEAPPTRLQR